MPPGSPSSKARTQLGHVLSKARGGQPRAPREVCLLSGQSWGRGSAWRDDPPPSVQNGLPRSTWGKAAPGLCSCFASFAPPIQAGPLHALQPKRGHAMQACLHSDVHACQKAFPPPPPPPQRAVFHLPRPVLPREGQLAPSVAYVTPAGPALTRRPRPCVTSPVASERNSLYCAPSTAREPRRGAHI